ncbi:spore germination protein [Fictibacillus sp. BK138]|uniref:spore germination protein n=1 Tax=Fictibacillus sp. BK138 TaxID=2512121 RepID=UPI0010290CAC|nr:spore germination protein [Fictibacillus sp. BK138]RZT23582.1 spore germination protein [Fictibacillus sp. BK138]
MKRRKSKTEDQQQAIEKEVQSNPLNFTGNLSIDLDRIRSEIGQNGDVHIREFKIGSLNARAALIFIDGLADTEIINNNILRSLMSVDDQDCEKNRNIETSTRERLSTHMLLIGKVNETSNIQSFDTAILAGSAGLLVEGTAIGFVLDVAKAKTRNIEEPLSESLVRGPRVGFVEQLSDNTALLRNLSKTQDLAINTFKVGTKIKKDLAIVYMRDIVDPQLLEEVIQRIQTINIDNLPESGYVEQLIEDNQFSPFPQIQNTERPDRVMGAILEGRVGILLDGTPFALILPVTFNMLLQSPEDYYERWISGTLIRMLRYLAAFIALFGPSLYIAFSSFHQGLIPTKLAISIAASREGVPFPPLIEALIMEISIEILREAGLRLPKPVGQSLGIVGGLIVGEAAVQAGIVSPIMVIVVAVTAISSFTLPHYSIGITIRFLRFVVMLFSAVYGLYGVVLFVLLLCTHLVKLKSFNVPYLSPAVPYQLSDLKDFLIRAPLSMMKRRPKLMHTQESKRK